MRSLFRTTAARPGLVLVCLLSVALGFSLAANFYKGGSNAAIAADAEAAARLPAEGFTDVAEKLAPCVVNITSEKVVEARRLPRGFEDFFDFGPFRMPEPGPRRQEATGSGVIVRADGYIMTNDHVVAGADRVTVRLPDGRKFDGTVLRDPLTDLALVKIDAAGLPTAEFADSDRLKVGQWAIAIGNPFGLRNTVTVGVISALRREAYPDTPVRYPEMIQTDASINPGNSGGPLVDTKGKVIGINFLIYSQSGGNVGIGFAVPSNTAQFVMDRLIRDGKVVRGYFGLVPTDLTPALAESLKTKEGALVESVEKDSPAAKGGIQVKDVIVMIDDKPITTALSLRRTVERLSPGSEVKVTVVRDGARKTLTVKLGEAPGTEGGTPGETEDNDKKIGLSVQPLTEELAKQLGIDPDVSGVVVRSVTAGSAADRAGIRVKDVIIEIDNTAVTSVATFSKAVKQLKSGDTAIVVIQRGDRTQILEMRID